MNNRVYSEDLFKEQVNKLSSGKSKPNKKKKPKKKRKSLKDWEKSVADNIASGKLKHQQYIEEQAQKQQEYIESKESEIVRNLREEGKTQSEIDEFLTNWHANLK